MHVNYNNTTHPLTTLPDLASARVLVIGDVMLDSYWHGSTHRISPEAPVPVVHVKEEEERVGGAGNVAINIASLGGKAQLLGLVGDDFGARQLAEMLAERGVTPLLQQVKGSRTIKKLRIVSKHQQLLRADFEDSFPAMDSEALRTTLMDHLADTDVVVLSDYAKGTLRDAALLVAAARQAGKKVIVDPKGKDFTRYRGATLITPNMSEFEAVVGHCPDEQAIIERGEALCAQLELEALLVTRSEKGMTLLARGQVPMHIPTHAREVYDVTGAGDTVVATLAAALAAGVPLREAVALSNIAAGIVVGKLGTATVSSVELQRALHDRGAEHGMLGVCNESELLQMVALAKARGERIVMTNGCFDLLHPGHIDYLETARELGDRLIVAVNDDASVRGLKGESRPINKLASRMRVLSGLAAVDWVVPFSEDTPARLIDMVLPDLLVKGGDYSPDEVAGGASVRAAGGEVRILSFTAGNSTSGIINKIQEVKQ